MSNSFGWKDHQSTFFNTKVLHTAGAQFTKVSRSRDALKMLNKPVNTNKLTLEYDSSMNAHIYDSEFQADRQKQIQHDYKYYVPGQQTMYFHRQTTNHKRMNTDSTIRQLQNIQQQDQDDTTSSCLQSVKLLTNMTKSLQLHEGSQQTIRQLKEGYRQSSQSLLSSFSSLNLSSKLSSLNQVSTHSKKGGFQIKNGSNTERIQRMHNSRSEDWNYFNSNSYSSFKEKENSMNKLKTLQGLEEDNNNSNSKLPQLECVLQQFQLIGSKSKELSSVSMSPTMLSQKYINKKDIIQDGDHTDQPNTVSSQGLTKTTTSSTKNSNYVQTKKNNNLANFGQQDHHHNHRRRQYSEQQLFHGEQGSFNSNKTQLMLGDITSNISQLNSVVGSFLSSTKMENMNDDFMRMNNKQKKAYYNSEAFSSKQNEMQRYFKQTNYQQQQQLGEKRDEKMDKKDQEIVDIQELNVLDGIREGEDDNKKKKGDEDNSNDIVKKILLLQQQPLGLVSTSPLQSPQLLNYINILDEQLSSKDYQQQQILQQLQMTSPEVMIGQLSSLTRISNPGGVMITEGQLFSVEEETSSACKNSIGTQQNEDICYDSEGEEIYPRRIISIQERRINGNDKDEDDEQDHTVLKCMQIHQGGKDNKTNMIISNSSSSNNKQLLIENHKKDNKISKNQQSIKESQMQQQLSNYKVDKQKNDLNIESHLKQVSRKRALDAGGLKSNGNGNSSQQQKQIEMLKEGQQLEQTIQRYTQNVFEVSPNQGSVRRLEWRAKHNEQNNIKSSNNNNNINAGKILLSSQEKEKTQSQQNGLVLPSILDGKSLHLVVPSMLPSAGQQYSARFKHK